MVKQPEFFNYINEEGVYSGPPVWNAISKPLAIPAEINDKLVSLGTLEVLQGSLIIRENSVFKDLGNLHTVSGNLTIYLSTNLEGLGKLKCVKGYLDVDEQPLMSYGSLETVGLTLYPSLGVAPPENLSAELVWLHPGEHTTIQDYLRVINKIKMAPLTDLPLLLKKLSTTYSPFIQRRLKGQVEGA